MKSRRFTAVSLCQWHTLTQHLPTSGLNRAPCTFYRCPSWGHQLDLIAPKSNFRFTPEIELKSEIA